jgi:hypothetical protein
MSVIAEAKKRALTPFFGVFGEPCIYTVHASGDDLPDDVQVIIKKNVETFDQMGMLVGYDTHAKFRKDQVNPLFRDVLTTVNGKYQVEKLVKENRDTVTMLVLELNE